MPKTNYIILGANNSNKGAQAMLYITATEIWKRDPDAQIIVFDASPYYTPLNIENLGFEGKSGIIVLSNSLLAQIACLIKGEKKRKKGEWKENVDSALKNSKIMIDISGYALGSNWSFAGCVYYLLCCQLMTQYNIPFYLMPQTFGPFNYKKPIQQIIINYCIKKYLGKANRIFAREKEGYNYLTNKYKLNNVSLSNDLVIQHNTINTERLFKSGLCIKEHKINLNSVAIIPNSKNNKYIDKNIIMDVYNKIIEYLLQIDKNVYIISHCDQDLQICVQIKQMFTDKDTVNLLTYTPDCIEFEEIVKKMDFCIASRFHSIVHSFKNYVPCIAIGWSNKYKELLQGFSQEKYYLDARETLRAENVVELIDNINANFRNDSKKIKSVLCEVQKESCFSFLDDIK